MEESMLEYVQDLAAEHGWTPATTVIVLCQVIDRVISEMKLDRSDIAELIEKHLP